MRTSGSFRGVAARGVTSAWSVLLGVVFATSLASCAVVRLAQGTRGTDVSSLQPGASRTAVESVLGFPRCPPRDSHRLSAPSSRRPDNSTRSGDDPRPAVYSTMSR